MDKNHNQLHNIVDEAKGAIYVKDLKGYYTMINPAGALLIGKPVKDIIGKDDMDLFSPEAALLIMEKDQSVITSGRTYEFEETLTSSGITRTYLTTKLPNKDHLGNTIGLIGISRDISERKDMETLIKYKILFDNISDLAYICDTKGRILFVNNVFETMTGHKPKEFSGRSFAPLFDEKEMERVTNIYARTLKGESPQYELRFKDTGILCEFKNIPLKDKKGDIIGVIGIARDITACKLTKDNLYQRTELVKLQHEITLSANEAPTVEEAMKFCLTRICNYTGWPIGHVYIPDSSGKLLPTDIWYTRDKKKFKKFREITKRTTFTTGVGLPGRVFRDARPHWIVDATKDPGFIRTKLMQKGNVKGAFAFPVLERKKVVAILEFFSEDVAMPDTLMLDTITQLATQLGRVTERKKTELMLQEQKKVLVQKNIALNELLGQLEIEKRYIKDNVTTNAENLLLPIIQKLKLTGQSTKYVLLLQKNIQELASSFGTKLIKEETKLTSREIEICNMIKHGLTSKEIAGLLNITLGTAGRHRNNIRKKLGIINEECNLSSFLDKF